jgi:hypothetical protein
MKIDWEVVTLSRVVVIGMFGFGELDPTPCGHDWTMRLPC